MTNIILPFHRSKRADSDARGRINYPRQLFPLSSSDGGEKSGPYQRLKELSASQAIYIHFTLPLPLNALFVSRRLVSLYPHLLHLFTLCSPPTGGFVSAHCCTAFPVSATHVFCSACAITIDNGSYLFYKPIK